VGGGELGALATTGVGAAAEGLGGGELGGFDANLGNGAGLRAGAPGALDASLVGQGGIDGGFDMGAGIGPGGTEVRAPDPGNGLVAGLARGGRTLGLVPGAPLGGLPSI
jgi:hypothetical protein